MASSSSYVLLACLFFPLATSAFAGNYYVDGTAGLDAPGRGGAATSAWQTIGYALANIPSSGTHTLHIAGGQSYALTTNGETFPLLLPPNVALRGTGLRPVLELPTNQRGLVLDSTTAFGPTTRIENLVMRGGGTAITLGGQGVDHSPVVVDCAFVGQSQESILIAPVAQSVTAPAVQRCTFDSNGRNGVVVRVSGSLTTMVFAMPRIEACTFRLDRGTGVMVDHGHDGPTATGVRTEIAECVFDGCQVAIWITIENLDASNRSEVAVTDTAIYGHRVAGIIVQAAMGGRIDSLAVERCSIAGGDAQSDGIVVSDAGPTSTVLVRDSLLAGGRLGLGLSGFAPLGTGVPHLTIEDTLVLQCRTGLSIGSASQAFTAKVRRSRFVGNRVGIVVRGPVPVFTTIQLDSSVIAGATANGIELDTAAVVRARHLTIADCAGTGLQARNMATGSTFEHCCFDGNGNDFTGTPAISISALRNPPIAGASNIATDPLLLRPSYKLAPTSPCIDAGSARIAIPATDYEGDRRLVTGRRGAFPDLGADEYVSGGSAHPYGVAGFGSGGFRPRIATPDLGARQGRDLQIDLRDAIDDQGITATAAVLLLGTRDVAVQALHGLGAPGSFLWTDIAANSAPLPVDSRGNATLQMPVPATPGALGRTVMAQWAVLKPAANPAGFATTGGLRATIGL